MFHKRFIHFIISCSIAFICLLITACGQEDKGTNDNTFSGAAIKGVISNGIISAYEFSQTNKVLLTQTRTNQSGRFNLDLSSNNVGQVILLELTTDQSTRMRCDITNGCIDQASGKLVSFGGSISLPSDFKLLGVVDRLSQSAYISPLTHLIVTTAKTIDRSLSLTAIQTATNWVNNALKLQDSPTQVRLQDITQLDGLSGVSNEALKQSIISAAMYDETLQANWSNGSQTIDSIDLKDILSKAASLTKDLSELLAQTDIDSSPASSLNRIQSELDGHTSELQISEMVILSHPSSSDVIVGQPLNLYVQASSDIGLHYQWFKNDDAITGANAAIYSKPNTDFSDAGIYNVLVSNDFSVLMSLSAVVHIDEAPAILEISQQPKSLSVSEGEPILLSVSAVNDSTASFQWQKDGSVIPNANQKTLLINSSQLSDAGIYRVSIANQHSTVHSNFVNVWVTEQLEPVSINNHPKAQTVSEGDTVSFSVKATGDGFLRYQWRKNGVAIENAYEPSLNIPASSLLNEGSYDVVVTNSQGSLESKSAELTVLPNIIPIIISQQPQPKSVSAGDAFSLSLSASGGDQLEYQWFLNGEAIDNANSDFLNIENAAIEDSGYYSVRVNDENSSQQSELGFVSVTPPPLKSLELTWDTPTEREDGSLLDFEEIQGYIIEYGYDADDLEYHMMTERQVQNILTLDGLESGTLYLRIATIDSSAMQGKFSALISVTL